MTTVAIRGEIDDAMAQRFELSMAALAGGYSVEIIIDSNGGCVQAAEKMHEAIREHRGRTSATLIAADSAGLIPALACREVVVAKGASFLIHNASIQVPRSVLLAPADLRASADYTDDATTTISRLMERKSGATDGFWRSMMAEGRHLDAEEMVKLRLADRISPYTAAQLRAERLRSERPSPVSPRAAVQGYYRSRPMMKGN